MMYVVNSSETLCYRGLICRARSPVYFEPLVQLGCCHRNQGKLFANLQAYEKALGVQLLPRFEDIMETQVEKVGQRMICFAVKTKLEVFI
jgi:hypothetical protein